MKPLGTDGTMVKAKRGSTDSDDGTLSQSQTSSSSQQSRDSGDQARTDPKNKFLLGCVFWAAEFSEAPKENDCRTIAKYGGEVVSDYDPMRVTHVLCKTQHFPEVQQVLKDGMRCVTFEWLKDTVSRRIVQAPYYARHLPTCFSGENLPLEGRTLSLKGFHVHEQRDLVKTMLKRLGANLSDSVSKSKKRNDGVIALDSNDWKFNRSDPPIFNIQFLNDLLIDNLSWLEALDNPKYQKFNLEHPFQIDNGMTEHLLAAWKVPIRVRNGSIENLNARQEGENFNCSQDLPEAVTSQQLPAIAEPSCDNSQAVENDTVAEESEMEKPDSTNESENKLPPVIMFIGCDQYCNLKTTKDATALGAQITTEIDKATHIICSGDSYTHLTYVALSLAKFIVGYTWIVDSIEANRFIDEAGYIIRNPKFEIFHKVKISEVLKKPNRHLLFKGMTFIITPGIPGTERNLLVWIILAAGGRLEQVTMEDLEFKEINDPENFIVITTVNDLDQYNDILISNPLLPRVYTVKYLFDCIAQQKMDVYPTMKKESNTAHDVM